MSTSKFHRNHSQHISISEKLSEEFKKAGQDILSQLSYLNQKGGADQLLITVINLTVRGIFGVIPDLEEIVIKINTKEENNDDLKDIIKKLNQYCNEMVQEYDSDSNTLNQKFKIFIQNILLEAEALLNIIKKDSHHDFKHELVENLQEIAYTIRISQVRIEVENYNHEELKNLTEDIQKEFFNDIAILENCSLDFLKTIPIIARYNTKHVLKIGYQLNKVASNYHDINMQHRLLEDARLLNVVTTSALFGNEKLTDTKQAIAMLTQWGADSWNAVKILHDFNNIRFENTKSSKNFRDLALYVVSMGITLQGYSGKSYKNNGFFCL